MLIERTLALTLFRGLEYLLASCLGCGWNAAQSACSNQQAASPSCEQQKDVGICSSIPSCYWKPVAGQGTTPSPVSPSVAPAAPASPRKSYAVSPGRNPLSKNTFTLGLCVKFYCLLSDGLSLLLKAITRPARHARVYDITKDLVTRTEPTPPAAHGFSNSVGNIIGLVVAICFSIAVFIYAFGHLGKPSQPFYFTNLEAFAAHKSTVDSPLNPPPLQEREVAGYLGMEASCDARQ